MPALLRPLALAAVAATAAFAGPSHAALPPVCAGTANTAIFCVTANPAGLPGVNPNGSSYDDCVYVGAPPCTPVHVPIPTVTPGSGQVVYLSCGGPLIYPILACQ
jgi:hypothetical protein